VSDLFTKSVINLVSIFGRRHKLAAVHILDSFLINLFSPKARMSKSAICKLSVCEKFWVKIRYTSNGKVKKEEQTND